jgi:hypothetical protein
LKIGRNVPWRRRGRKENEEEEGERERVRAKGNRGERLVFLLF